MAARRSSKAWAPLLAALALGAATAARGVAAGSEADLELTKTASAASVAAGGELTYTLTVTNDGPQDTDGVVLVDSLSSSVSLISADADLSAATTIFADGFESGDLEAWWADACSQSDGGTEDTVTCDLKDLPSEGQAVVTLVVEVAADAGGETLTNTAWVSAEESDPDLDNNTASVDTEVTSLLIDLGLEIADDPDPVAAGGMLTYALTVTNAGPGEATGVTLEDFLPIELSPLSSVPSQGSCALAGRVVTCELGSVDPDATATVAIVTSVDAGATVAITNPAAVFGDQTEANPADNTASEVTTVESAFRSRSRRHMESVKPRIQAFDR